MNSNKRVPTKPVGSFSTAKLPTLLVNDEPLESPRQSLSDLKRKPRRSMLGRRRTLVPSQNDEIQTSAQQPASSPGAVFVAKPRWSTLVRKTPLLTSGQNQTMAPPLPPSSSGIIFNVPKPRRSMLGRKNLLSNTNKSEGFMSSFPKPVGTSSPKHSMASSTPIEGHENPFDDQNLDSSAFFNGKSDFSTWSIFKKTDTNQFNNADKTKKIRPTIFRPLVFDKPEQAQKEAVNETSLGVEPLSTSIEPDAHEITYEYVSNEERCNKEDRAEISSDVQTEQKSESTFQDEENTVVENCQVGSVRSSSGKKKFSVIREEDEDCTTAIFIPAKVIAEEPPVTPEIPLESAKASQSNITDLINKWNSLYSQWKNTCEEMESVGKEITERLQSIETKNANESLTDEANKENAPLRQMRKSMFNNYKSQFTFIQTPKNVKSNKPSTTSCYTPNSFSARVTSAMKDIYN